MRTRSFPPRQVQPDLQYGSTKVTKLINRVMKDGKKTVAQKQVYDALAMLAKQTGKDAVEAFEMVLDRVQPEMEVRSRRVGGASYQVPLPVKPRRGSALAIRWLVDSANKRSSKEFHSFAEKLAAEMLDSLNNQGGAINKRDTAHKMADANKAFAHFRW